MTENLKPCPFCGGIVSVTDDMPARLYNELEKAFCVICPACELIFGWDCDYGGQFSSQDEAIDAWNRRVNP